MGELVVNCLVEIGSVAIGDARKALKAGRTSLEVIGNERGFSAERAGNVRYNKGFQRSRPVVDYSGRMM